MDLKIGLLYIFLRCHISLAYGVSLFTSSRCRQCNRFNKTYNNLVESYPSLDFEKIYLNETTKAYAQKMNVRSIPLLLFGEGKDDKDRVLGIPHNYEKIMSKCKRLSEQEPKSKYSTSNNMNSNAIKKEHLVAAKLCKSIYDDVFLRSCEEFVEHPETDVQCGIMVSESTMFVCFRGSDDIIDWKQNFQFHMTTYPHGSDRKYHTGFLTQWLSVKHDVITKISTMLETHRIDIDTVVFTGHSAGSQVTLAALDLENMLRNIHGLELKVITFGSPRLCNSKFEKHFESHIECTRYVNDRDIITRFPISSWGGYRHLGNAIQMRNKSILTRDTSVFEAVILFMRGIPKIDIGVKDHDISEYVKNIEKWLEKQ